MIICSPWLYWYVLLYIRIYSYILVYTRTYSYILSYNNTYLESGWSRLVMTYCLCCTLVLCIAHSILPFWGLLDGHASQAGLAKPKLPQPRVDLIDIAAPQSVRWICVGAAIREAWILALVEHVRNCWSRVTSKKQWDKRNSAHHILDISHFNKVYTGIYLYSLGIYLYHLYILLYTSKYHDIRTYTTSTKYLLVHTGMYSVYLGIYDW